MTETSHLALAAEFDTATREQWRALVADVLRKTGAADRDTELPEPERLLASTVDEGIELSPLYTAADVADLPATGLPGMPPFVRGATPEGHVATGWDIRQWHAATDPSTLNTDLLTDLENGVSSVWLPVGGGTLAVDDLAAALDGVAVDMAPVVLEPGADYLAAADALLALLAARDIPGSEAVGVLGADPIGLRARTGRAHDVAPAAELAAVVARSHPRLRPIVVDALPYHDAGGSDSQELAASLATGVAYLRALTAAGLDGAAGADALEFRYAAGADQFLTIAKLRAARRVWARVCRASGIEAAHAAQRQHVVTSSAMLTRRDPWVNLLRGTIACFGAAVGGADAITVQPFDAAIGASDAFAKRIARNTAAILLEESKLAGVIDPVGGSWYVENLTDRLAHAAWRQFQDIDAAGGIESALDSGILAGRLDETWQRRRHRLATRTDPVVGVSQYPQLDEQPVQRPPHVRRTASGGLPQHRYAEDFEALRDRSDAYRAEHGGRPRVYLATLGPLAEHTARATFAANLFSAGGLEPINPGPTESTADVLAGFVGSGARIACLCGTDLAYAEQADEVITALRDAGAAAVLLAGKPSDAYDVTAFVHAGGDALDVLTEMADIATTTPAAAREVHQR